MLRIATAIAISLAATQAAHSNNAHAACIALLDKTYGDQIAMSATIAMRREALNALYPSGQKAPFEPARDSLNALGSGADKAFKAHIAVLADYCESLR